MQPLSACFTAVLVGTCASLAPCIAQEAQPGSKIKLEPIKIGDTQVFHPELQPQGLPGVGLTPADVERAVRKGREFLWKKVIAAPEGESEFSPSPGETVLIDFALLHSGAKEAYPAYATRLKKFLTDFQPTQLESNYVAGLVAMLTESNGDPALGRPLALAARFAVESQGKEGSWTYNSSDDDKLLALLGKPGAAPVAGQLKRATPWSMGAEGDNSVSQFALLGLWSANRWGLEVPKDLWTRSLKTIKTRQCADGGWAYNEAGDEGYGSMTCAGICSTAIASSHLGKQPLQDPSIHQGLAWLIRHWTLDKNPNSEEWHYYYLYSLERAGRILDLDFIGNREWYPLGAKFLIKQQQPDGSWVSEREQAPMATAFAMLFLTKATPSLQPQQSADGTLAATLKLPPDDRLYIILDASGSMLKPLGGKPKFELARQAVAAIIQELPPGREIALRVYGNHLASKDKNSALDTTLEIPLAPLDKAAFLDVLNTIQARGDTPIALSLERTKADLLTAGVSSRKPATVALLTDGMEDTAAKRDPLAAAAEFAKLEGVRLHVVGYDIGEASAAAQLRQLVATAKGQYWPVNKGDDLARELKALMVPAPAGFAVRQGDREVATGIFGQPLKLKAGQYTLRALVMGKPLDRAITITPGATTTVELDLPPVKAPTP